MLGTSNDSDSNSDSDNDMEEYNEMRVRINHLYQENRNELMKYIEDNSSFKVSQPIETMTEPTPYVYDYPAINTQLQHDPTNIYRIIKDNSYSSGTIHLCAYHVNTSGKHPFLQYILQKYSSDHAERPDLIKFPEFDYKPGTDIMSLCDCLLNIIFIAYSKCKSTKSSVNPYICDGFLQEGADFYLFFNCSAFQVESHKLDRRNDMWLTLIDEIVNYKSVCNFKIDDAVTSFFVNHKEFMYLTDINDNHIEIPCVAYTGCHYRMLTFKLLFGQSATHTPEIVESGPYYYFTDFNESIKMGTWSPDRKVEIVNETVQITDEFGRYDRGGIVRFAIFAGHMYCNLNDNPVKEWPEDYDSIYCKNWWVLKYDDQDIPLTSHIIDNRDENESAWTIR